MTKEFKDTVYKYFENTDYVVSTFKDGIVVEYQINHEYNERFIIKPKHSKFYTYGMLSSKPYTTKHAKFYSLKALFNFIDTLNMYEHEMGRLEF